MGGWVGEWVGGVEWVGWSEWGGVVDGGWVEVKVKVKANEWK